MVEAPIKSVSELTYTFLAMGYRSGVELRKVLICQNEQKPFFADCMQKVLTYYRGRVSETGDAIVSGEMDKILQDSQDHLIELIDLGPQEPEDELSCAEAFVADNTTWFDHRIARMRRNNKS